MYIFIILIITIIAILICVVVLLQAGRGGGLAGIGGGQATQVLGARQAPDFLEKVTWSLGTAFIVLCILANFFASPTEEQRSVILGTEPPAQTPLPGGPGTIQDDFLPPAPADQLPAPAPAPNDTE